MSYAVLAYNASNVGDEIQSIAASRFLPQINHHILREGIHKTEAKSKIILNAYWSGSPKNFPPSSTLIGLPISMHLTEALRANITSKSLDWLKANAPIGCRDRSTLEFLESKGIPCYFSCCLTLTLQRSEKLTKQDWILCVDVPEDVQQRIRQQTKRKLISLTRITHQYMSPMQKMKLAKVFLQLYQQAHCVVSPNLHTVMPSLALETPVLNLDTGKRDVRFTGLLPMLRQLEYTANGNIDYDFDNPPENPILYMAYRNLLIEKASAFTEYNSTQCQFDLDNSVVELAALFGRSKKKDIRALTFYTPKELFKGFVKRFFTSKTDRYEYPIDFSEKYNV